MTLTHTHTLDLTQTEQLWRILVRHFKTALSTTIITPAEGTSFGRMVFIAPVQFQRVITSIPKLDEVVFSGSS